MNVPAPWRDCTTPIAARARSPARTLGRLDADAQRQLALGRQPSAGTKVTALDQLAHVADDELCGDPFERFLGGL